MVEASDRSDLLVRLRKIEGQLRGIQRMIERGEEPAGVLTQIAAAISGLERVALRLVGDHLRHLVGRRSGAEEAIRVVERFLQT